MPCCDKQLISILLKNWVKSDHILSCELQSNPIKIKNKNRNVCTIVFPLNRTQLLVPNSCPTHKIRVLKFRIWKTCHFWPHLAVIYVEAILLCGIYFCSYCFYFGLKLFLNYILRKKYSQSRTKFHQNLLLYVCLLGYAYTCSVSTSMCSIPIRMSVWIFVKFKEKRQEGASEWYKTIRSVVNTFYAFKCSLFGNIRHYFAYIWIIWKHFRFS